MSTPPTEIPDAIRKKMARLYDKDGLTVATLKERFGYGYERICTVIEEEGVTLRVAGKRLGTCSTGLP